MWSFNSLLVYYIFGIPSDYDTAHIVVEKHVYIFFELGLLNFVHDHRCWRLEVLHSFAITAIVLYIFSV